MWAEKGHHQFSEQKAGKYHRFTLKADPLKSFQPQNSHGRLLDIRPILNDLEVDMVALEIALGPKAKNSYSRPYYLDVQVACTLYRRIQAQAEVHRTGADFVKVRNSRKRQRGRWS